MAGGHQGRPDLGTRCAGCRHRDAGLVPRRARRRRLRVASGAITVANLVAFILFLFMMIMPLGQAFGAITAVNSALGALGRIQEIIDLPGEREGDRGDRAGGAHRDGCGDLVPGSVVRVRGRRRRGAGAGARRRHLRCEARAAHRPRRTVRRRQEHDPRAHRAVLRPGCRCRAARRRRHAPGSTAPTLRAQIGYVEQDAPVLAGSPRDNLLLGIPGRPPTMRASRCCVPVNLGEVLDRDARRTRRGGGRRRRHALGRRAPAPRDCACPAGGPAHPAARRVDLDASTASTSSCCARPSTRSPSTARSS